MPCWQRVFGERLEARRAGRVEPPQYDNLRDPETALLNPRGIADYSVTLADAVGRTIDVAEFPVVLGGDCSIVLGCLLALRRRGRYGLLFIDGHADFYQADEEPNGEAASMDLALATGRGPAIVTNLEGRRPLVRDEDVVALGRRDAEVAEAPEWIRDQRPDLSKKVDREQDQQQSQSYVQRHEEPAEGKKLFSR
jgi:arginase